MTMKDVFYYGTKPNVHPREKFARSIAEARQLCTTDHFWIINEFCDYTSFDWDWDFEFLPDADVWAEDHNNVWASVHQKDSGTWLCSKNPSDVIIYRADGSPLRRKNELSDNWTMLEKIDIKKFDFSWHPDPTDPPYTYVWGNKFYPPAFMPCLKYHMPGSIDVKYMTSIVQLEPDWDCLVELQTIDRDSFDLSWRPDPREPPYIYVWGNKWNPVELDPVLEYHAPGATEKKYMRDPIKVIPELDRWKILQEIDETKFDLSWRPDPREPAFIYVWGNKWNPVELEPVLEYHMPGATTKKYMSISVEVLPQIDRWDELQPFDKTKFDLSWRPDPREPAFIYVWGNQWNKPEDKVSLLYRTSGATEFKYMTERIIKLPCMDNWELLEDIDKAKFDFSWEPNPHDPPYIYVWGNQWNKPEDKVSLLYKISDATEFKYMTERAIKLPCMDNWELLEPIDESKFDFSWEPNPHDPPYIYVWGNTQYPGAIMPTLKFNIPGATQEKHMSDVTVKLKQDPMLFGNTELITGFDFSWRPDPTSPPFIYQFGTQWAKTHGPTFIVDGATVVKYVSENRATRLPSMEYWSNPSNSNVTSFDFSWHPDATSPPKIYQFGTLLDRNDGPVYSTPSNDGEIIYIERIEKHVPVGFNRYYVDTTLPHLIQEHPNEIFWALNRDLDYSKFDFTWRPDITQNRYTHVFGFRDSPNTQTYLVNSVAWLSGFTEMNYVEEVEVTTKIDMFYIDRGNAEAIPRFNDLKTKYGSIQKTRYLNSWADTIARCINKTNNKLCWILNSELDYSAFDFSYYPNSWQMNMVHVFGTQWSHWGTTFLINREIFVKDTQFVKVIEHLSNLNFVKSHTAIATECLYDVYIINHGNSEIYDVAEMVGMKTTGKKVTTVPYKGSYLKTFADILATEPAKKDHYIWVCSSVCDYIDFDFSYICDPFTKEQLHVFPSNSQKYGDTFLLNVNKLRELIDEMHVIEDYKKINYNAHQVVPRLPAPLIETKDDTHVSTISTNFDFPYAIFLCSDNADILPPVTEPMSLWSPETKSIIITSTGGTRLIVPKEAKDHVVTQLYDYPYVTTSSHLVKSKPLDVVFLSNGEPGADENYAHLLRVMKGLPNRVVRVSNVNGRTNAYHAAAEASRTPWMFTVFAKLEVSANFDWSWQPDRLQESKHYIFHAFNPLNKLEYGHQAIIAYNKKLTLANNGVGLDFTLDSPHAVVESLSGVAKFNTDPFSTWRTAFREVIKLRADPSYISKDRLDTWLTVASGDYAEYCINGAKDAIEYYEEVNGELDMLKLSYEWKWLRERFEIATRST